MEDAIEIRITDKIHQQTKCIAVTKAFLLDNPDRVMEHLETHIRRSVMEIANKVAEEESK